MAGSGGMGIRRFRLWARGPLDRLDRIPALATAALCRDNMRFLVLPEARRPHLASQVLGRSLREARYAEGKRVHLLSALVHKEDVVIGQRHVDGKHNGITKFTPLLDHINLEGKVVTADAMHALTEHAR